MNIKRNVKKIAECFFMSALVTTVFCAVVLLGLTLFAASPLAAVMAGLFFCVCFFCFYWGEMS